MQGGAMKAMSVHIVEERQRRRCPRQAGTQRGLGPRSGYELLSRVSAEFHLTFGYDKIMFGRLSRAVLQD
jgi:hypothetical protein